MDTATAARMASATQQRARSQSQDQMGSRQPGHESRSEHTEGSIARTIEEQTAKLPSDLFLWAAFGSIGRSLFFRGIGEVGAGGGSGQKADDDLIGQAGCSLSDHPDQSKATPGKTG